MSWFSQFWKKKPSTRALLRTLQSTVESQRDLVLHEATKKLQTDTPNPLNAFGLQCFSQSDEDGITLEILRRMGKLDRPGVFAELGVADGTENNTLILKALGWRGCWVGGDDLAFDYQNSDQFKYLKAWITRTNVAALLAQGLSGKADVDVFSLDLDGNDIHFLREVLGTGHRPALCIVEYNAKFPIPLKFEIAYSDTHTWDGSDYFGASLASFCEEFAKYGYRLVCCNAHTGANAFFVRQDYAHLFNDVPTDIAQIYMPPRYHLYKRHGHPVSKKTLAQICATV